MKETLPEITTDFAPKKKEQLLADALQMIANARKNELHSKLLDAAAYFNVKRYKLHGALGMTWEEFCGKDGIKESWGNYMAQAGEALAAFAVKAKPELAGKEFLFTHAIISEVFIHRFPDCKRVNIKDLAKLRNDNIAIENYFKNGSLGSKELLAHIPHNQASYDELPAVPPNLGDDLFTTYNNMKAKGYSYDKELRRYIDSNGNELTDEQLGECVDEKDAYRIFDSLATVLEKSQALITDVTSMYSRFHIAYVKMHPSSENEADARYTELLLKVKELQSAALNFHRN